MTTEFLRPEHPEEEDSWSDLAGELFGIDFAQTPQSGEFVSPEELLAEDDQTPADSEESKDPALTVETEETVEAERSEEAEESPSSAIEADAKEQETSPPVQSIPDVEGTGDKEITSEPDRSTDKTEKDDTFWDVLDDWNWDEGKGQVGSTGQDSHTPQRSPGKRSSHEREQPVSSRILREEDNFSSAEDLHEEYIEDSGFGAGLLKEEGELVSEPENSDSAEEQTEQPEQTGQAEEPRSKSQRSRRRRRRPRRATKETGDVETVSEGDEKVELKEESSDREESSDQDDSAEATPQRRSSRRRSSRGRRRRSDSPAAERDSQASESTGESDEFGESIFDEDLKTDSEESSQESQDLPSKTEEKSKLPYHDVPSWEEAISYLLSPSKPTAQTGSKSKTAPASTATQDSSDSSKPASHHRRRRRR